MVTQGNGFASAYDFHVAIKNIVQQARDGHFHYTPPRGFGAYFVLQPMQLRAELDPNDPTLLRFFMKADASLGVHDQFFPNNNKAKLSSYVGREVVSIDGVPTYDYINSISRQFPMGKDDGINFNYWLFHVFTFRGLNLPQANSFKVEFAPTAGQSGTEEVTINYLVLDANQGISNRLALNRAQTPGCRQKRSEGASDTVPIDDSENVEEVEFVEGGEIKTISEIQRDLFTYNWEDWHTNTVLEDEFKQMKVIQDVLTEYAGTGKKRSVRSFSSQPFISQPPSSTYFL